jgi:hypothetical protein
MTRWALGATVVLAVVSTASGEVVRECGKVRREARSAARAELDRQGQICMGNRDCLARAEATWQATTKRIDDERRACDAELRRREAAQPPPWANWKPGDPPPRAKDGRYYLMSCSGKVLGLYRPGGALEMELKTRGGSCHPARSWGELHLKPGEATNQGYCPDGRRGTFAEGCVHASPPRN